MSPAMLRTAETAPLYWRRSFPGAAEQARAVRRFVGCLLAGSPHLDDALLSVDEFVVNALRHTKSGRPGGAFIVEVMCADEAVSVSVTDEGGPSEPAVTDAGDYAECGRGLRTVSALAFRWGWFGNDQARTVTAVFTARTAA